MNGLFEQVVINSTTLISTFKQFTNLLKNIDKIFATL